MPKGTAKVPGVTNAGAGKPGYCKLCDFADGSIQNQFDDRVRKGWTPRQLNDWLARQIEGWYPASKMTVYKHRTHAQHPQDRLVTAVKRTEQRALQTKPTSSPDEFLHSLVSVGQQRVIDSPDDVTIDHALRAAAELKKSKSQSDGLSALVALLTQRAAPPTVITVIEGQAEEVQ